MASVVYVDLNLEFDLGRTTCMQLEVFAQERQRRQTVTSSFCRTRKLLLHSLLPLLPPSSLCREDIYQGDAYAYCPAGIRWAMGLRNCKLAQAASIASPSDRSVCQPTGLFAQEVISAIISNLNDLFVLPSKVWFRKSSFHS